MNFSTLLTWCFTAHRNEGITSCLLHEDAATLIHGSKALGGRSVLGTADLFSSAKDGGVLQPDPVSPVHACVPSLKTRLLPTPCPQDNTRARGFRLCWSLSAPPHPVLACHPATIWPQGKISPGLNLGRINN